MKYLFLILTLAGCASQPDTFSVTARNYDGHLIYECMRFYSRGFPNIGGFENLRVCKEPNDCNDYCDKAREKASNQ